MSDRAAELGADLQNAADAPAILDALARAVWFNELAGAECPPAAMLTPADLAAWVPEATLKVRFEAAKRVADTVAAIYAAGAPSAWPPAGDWSPVLLATLDPRLDGARVVNDLAASWLFGEEDPGPVGVEWVTARVHAAWKAAPGQPLHPLAPLVAAWQGRPLPAPWDERQHVNLPGPLTRTRYVVPARELRDGQAALPFDWDALATPPPDQPRFEVGYLPTLEPAPSLLPRALLDVFSAAASRGRGGPVPVPARIGWEVLVALGGDARERIGGPAILDCTLADLHSMVYPNTARWRKANGPALLRGLVNLDAARVRWRGDERGGLYPLVEVYRLPTNARPDELLAFLSHLPPGSRQGPQVDRLVLRILAAISARQHRLMLVAYCLFDQFGTVNGRLIAPTRPVVHRDAAGYVIDVRGKLIPERGAPTRRATHRRAVQTGERERNPERDRYPWLDGRDLILAGYKWLADTPAGRRDQRRRVLADAKALRDAGRLDFEEEHRTPRHGGPPELVALRPLPSAAHVEAHAARWAARKHGS